MKNRTLLFAFCALLILSFWDCTNSSQQQKTESAVTLEQKEAYIKKGKQIATATFTSLSQQLQKAVKEGGIPNAIQYCNIAAYPMTDSLSKVHAATIRRTSLKNRNPKNEPTELEKSILQDFANKAAAGQAIKPMIKLQEGQKVAFFAPIIVNDLCLKCHGKLDKTLTKENYHFIKEYYPEDKAIGYVGGELRGMWSIQFNQ